jgi:ferredoxin/flavodoxin
MDIKILIVYSSPAGSTRRVAEVIGNCFSQRNAEVEMLDLAKVHERSGVLDHIKAAGKHSCLFIGSPVYRDVAVPPVIKFIEALPEMVGAFAVPFVTWGQACSGAALWQLGNALLRKGFGIVGAAKVLAVHSMMWRVAEPAGRGHPDKSDVRKIEELAMTLHTRFDSGNIPRLSLDILDYQPRLRGEQMKQKINAPWMIVPKNVNTAICTQCGVCEEECPVAAVALNPYPEFNLSCFDCFNCIRLCPENAIEPAIGMDQIEEHIRERVRTIKERPLTEIFL